MCFKKKLLTLFILMLPIMGAQAFADTTPKNFTLKITNQTQNMDNSQYRILVNGVTTCTPGKGNRLPSQLSVSCKSPIPADSDWVSIHLEKYLSYSGYVWKSRYINLKNIKNGGAVHCYIVGTEEDVRMRCSA